MTPLLLNALRVVDLRCHALGEWQFAPGPNLIVGDNGCGKTTLLEAVALMAHGRSFRQARDPLLVRWGSERFAVAGEWRRFGPVRVNARGQRGQVELTLQGKSVRRRSDVSELLPVVIEAPHGRRIVEGATNERRRWLDHLAIALHEGLLGSYERYLRSVLQRNRLLRHGGSGMELEGWEMQIVLHGERITAARKQLIAELNRQLAQEKDLLDRPLKLRLEGSAPEGNEAWLTKLAALRSDDARQGGLRIGPHCDRLRLDDGGREHRNVGSRGQQKLAAIALKLAEATLRGQHRQLVPLLLLDDCLEALDRQRQTRLLRRLQDYPGQVLMTAPGGEEWLSGERLTIHRMSAAGEAGTMEVAA